jgi:hypothetical protein
MHHAVAGTALFEMYAMCGDITSTLVAFIKVHPQGCLLLERRDQRSGHARASRRRHHAVRSHEETGFQPNHFTFMGVLLACRCSHGGLVDEGLRLFDVVHMDHGIQPSLEHYGLRLPSQSALHRAVWVVWGMPCRPDSEVRRVLLGGCRVQASLRFGRSAEEVTVSVIHSEDECGIEDIT